MDNEEKQSRWTDPNPYRGMAVSRRKGGKVANKPFRQVFNAKMPGEWRLEKVIFIYKYKDNAVTFGNSKSTKLLSHTTKL